jgi:hypothetical protein
MINRIIKITEKEILKNKEKLDEQSKKNSAITVNKKYIHISFI